MIHHIPGAENTESDILSRLHGGNVPHGVLTNTLIKSIKNWYKNKPNEIKVYEYIWICILNNPLYLIHFGVN